MPLVNESAELVFGLTTVDMKIYDHARADADLLHSGAGTMRLEIASSLRSCVWLAPWPSLDGGGGGHTIRLSIMSSVDVFITDARSGGSVIGLLVSHLWLEDPPPETSCCEL